MGVSPPSGRTEKPLAVRLLIAVALAAGGLSAGCSSTPGVDPRAGARPPCRWVPACTSNYEKTAGHVGGAAPAQREITQIVIHDIEGVAAGAIRWFQNPRSHVSAHYVIDYDGAITQMVADADVAWHAGNHDVNLHSIGIEHSGFADRNLWTDAEYRASAGLVRWLCKAYGIPMTRQGILGHAEVPDPEDPSKKGGRHHHTDPGRFFDWPRFMRLVTTPDEPSRRTP
ncbi:MAG: N-acetylmuramoyl-L-alanine amidase [Planctomycetes bacterium]|nr:N-acetylmuramoyl-L-alanine amidase [Planctomycetota bacterium]